MVIHYIIYWGFISEVGMILNWQIDCEGDQGGPYRTASGRSIFSLPDGYKPENDQSYRSLFESWVRSKNERCVPQLRYDISRYNTYILEMPQNSSAPLR